MIKNHALTEKPGERFVEFNQTHITHDLGPESGVQQMKHGMFNAADVLIHRHPVVIACINHRLIIARGGVAHEIPG